MTRRAIPGLVLIASLLLYSALAVRFYQHIVDDAYISFRYAQNFADGHGFVFNPGETVEGYTNFLWVLLLGLGLKLNLDPELVSRLFGFAAGAGVLVASSLFGRRFGLSPATQWIAPLLLAVHPALTVWATGGLETSLFACLVTWGACLTIAAIEEGGHSPAGAFLLGLASLTRPEGVLIAALLMILSLAAGRRSGKTVSGTALWIGIFLAVWAPYFLWRWQYYGYLLPNTFYAKVDIGGSQIMRGLGYLHAFWKSTGYWLLLPIAGIAFLTKRRSSLIAAALVTAYILYIVYVGGDGLPMYRFLAPILGLLFLLVALGAEGWLTRFGHRRAAGSMVALAVVLTAAYAARPHFKGPEYAYVQQDIREVSAWKEIGLWFREHSSRGDMIAVLPAGAIPYFSGLAALDMLGLNDVTIAHTKVSMGEIQAGHEKYNIDYMLRRAPRYFIVGVYGLSKTQGPPLRNIQPYYPVELHLMSSPEFQRRYRPKLAKSSSGYFTYFEKREPPDRRP